MTRYFLYARKSEEDEGRQVLSIESQLTELREFAARESLMIAQEFIESRTAKVPGRPVFGEMMKKVQTSKSPIGLLAWHPDRLARNSVDGGLIIYLVDTGKLPALKFLTFWFESTPQGKFMLNIAFGQSKYYVDNLQENVKRGQRQKLRRGEYPGMAPLGYLNDRSIKTIVADPERAPMILKIFQAYGERKLNVSQIHAESIQWGLKSRLGKPLSVNTIWLMLPNPFYIGLFRWNEELHEGSHPPIIPRELFDKVQARLRDKKRPLHKWKTPLVFPLIGLLRCRTCGCSITAERQKGLHYYHCTRKKASCKEPFIREEMLAYCLKKIANQVTLPDSSAAPVFNQIELWRKKAVLSYEKLIPIFETKLQGLDLKIKRLLSGYLENAIEREVYVREKERILREKLDVKDQMARLKFDGDIWIEPMKRFFEQIFQISGIIQEKDLSRLKDLFKNTGAVLTLSARQAFCEWKNPWKILAEFNRNPLLLPLLLREVRAEFEQAGVRKEAV